MIMAIEVVVVLVPRISHIRRRSAFDTEEHSTRRATFLGAADAVQRVLAELFEPESGAQSARFRYRAATVSSPGPAREVVPR